MLKRLDRTFINAVKREFGLFARIIVTPDTYIIINQSGKLLELDVISCLRRSHEDHKEMLAYIRIRLFNERQC